MNLTIIDFNRTIYDPDQDGLIDGARELLEALSGAMPVVLVSKQESGRDDVLERLDIRQYFADVHFTTEKSARMFLDIMRRFGATPHSTLIIGDHPQREIAIGIELGARTVHFKQGRFAGYEYRSGEPWRVVEHLLEVKKFIG
jgi:FMN phosphatase YigB (HAD superfamily)